MMVQLHEEDAAHRPQSQGCVIPCENLSYLSKKVI